MNSFTPLGRRWPRSQASVAQDSTGYDQAPRAQDPAASGVRLGEAGRSPAEAEPALRASEPGQVQVGQVPVALVEIEA